MSTMRNRIIDLAKEVNIKISLYTQEEYAANTSKPNMMTAAMFHSMNVLQFISLVIRIHAQGTEHALQKTQRMTKDGLLDDPDFIKQVMDDYNRLREKYVGDDKNEP